MAPSSRERRLLKELSDIQKDTVDSGITVEPPDPANLGYMLGFIPGPPETPYAGGIFKVEIKIPDNYPFKPPGMKFLTKVWHPNISSQTGVICLDTLTKAWSPVQTIKTALLSCRLLLEAPEPKDPQDAEVGHQMLQHPDQWARMAQEWSIKYAGAPQQELDFSKYTSTPKELEANRYEGYNQEMVDRFADLGFQVEDIVRVFKEIKLPTRGGAYFPQTEEFMDLVTTRLLGE